MKSLLPKTVRRIRVPPIKSQGIKTKLVPLIASSVRWDGKGRWIEPFLGSGVVIFNIDPPHALCTDSNVHIISLYQSIQNGSIKAPVVRRFLESEGKVLSERGADHYYSIRDRFNQNFDPLDFLFLNRSCFNGVIRFNSTGKFNVPFCHKPDRFRPAYVTKICNQVLWLERQMQLRDWEFSVADWRDTIRNVTSDDFVYVDPPYVGRHTDYYNCWSDDEADELAAALKSLRCGFAYSMWLRNKYRENTHIPKWFSGYILESFRHYYHVGPTESLRNEMEEALIINPGNSARSRAEKLKSENQVQEQSTLL